eukprot:1412212-Prymnesium_polylepis.2
MRSMCVVPSHEPAASESEPNAGTTKSAASAALSVRRRCDARAPCSHSECLPRPRAGQGEHIT